MGNARSEKGGECYRKIGRIGPMGPMGLMMGAAVGAAAFEVLVV